MGGAGKRYQSLWEGEIGRTWYLYYVENSCMKNKYVITEENVENGAEVKVKSKSDATVKNISMRSWASFPVTPPSRKPLVLKEGCFEPDFKGRELLTVGVQVPHSSVDIFNFKENGGKTGSEAQNQIARGKKKIKQKLVDYD